MSAPATVREAARARTPLGGADAQALEGALQQAERELAKLKAEAVKWAQELYRIACHNPGTPEDHTLADNLDFIADGLMRSAR